MSKFFTTLRRFAGYTALAILLPVTGSTATLEEVTSAVRKQVAAKPAEVAAILEKNLRDLSSREQLRYASAVYAAALEGVEKNSDRVLQLFEKAVATVPRAVLGLMEVAHRAAPDRILDITEIAIRVAAAAGMEELVPSIVAKAVSLAPDQRAALTRLSLGMVPPGLADLILKAVAEALSSPGTVGGSAINGTMNPSNVGGNVVSPEQ